MWEQERPEFGQEDSNSRWLTAHWHGERTLPDDGQSAQNCLCTKAAWARQEDPAWAQQVLNWLWRAQRVETSIDHADEVLVEAQAEHRVAEQRRRTHATKT